MDVAQYQCTFALKNLSEKEEEVEVGFPVDSEFARWVDPDQQNRSQHWVIEYGFIARDQDSTYNVDFVNRKVQDGPGQFGSVFVWKMRFSPQQTRTLTVQYRIPMSMGLIPMAKDESSVFRPGCSARNSSILASSTWRDT